MRDQNQHPIDNWILTKEEPMRSYLDSLKDRILALDKDVSAIWRYQMPFFSYQGKRFCYLWIDKKRNQPYIGIVDGKQVNHPLLVHEKRTRMKILPLDANKDIPIKVVDKVLKDALNLVKAKVKSL